MPHKDTIPADLKELLVGSRSPPKLLTDYDVFGFDADCCFVKYNTQVLATHLIKVFLNDLRKQGYPEEVV